MTAKAAQLLAEAAGEDIYEIIPETPYTEADLNWINPKSRSSVEMKNKAFRPTIADTTDVYKLDMEKGFSLRPKNNEHGELSSSCQYLYNDLYRTPAGYEIICFYGRQNRSVI